MLRPAKALLFLLSLIFATITADAKEPLLLGKHFAWGAEAGTGIDMGGDDMSTINLRAHLGYSGPGFEILGVGAGIDMMMSNSCRSFPLYGIVRTGFSRYRKQFFAEMRAGVAVNQATDIPDRTNLFLQPGVGIHLANSRSYASYLSLSYTYNDMTFYGDRNDTLVHGLNYATLAIGIIF